MLSPVETREHLSKRLASLKAEGKNTSRTERDLRSAEKRAQAESRWLKHTPEPPPAIGTRHSVRTVSGGLPGHGKRR